MHEIEYETQLIVIGGGPGGYVAAIRAAQLGANVILVEKDKLGGVCLNRGCIPTKALLSSVETLETVRKAAGMGVKVGSIDIDLKVMNQRKDKVVNQLGRGVEYLLKANGVTVIAGEAEFVGDKNILVKQKDGQIRHLRGEKIIIATGSRPALIPIEGSHSPNVITSTEALNVSNLPKRFLIIGGGVIGTELGYAYSSLGAEVTIIEQLPRLLPGMDEEVVKEVTVKLNKILKIYTSAAIQRIVDMEDGSHVYCRLATGEEKEIIADKILMSVGRQPNSDSLKLDSSGIIGQKGYISVNEEFETRLEGVYAIGDVNGKSLLAHAASAQGVYVAEKIMGHGPTIDLSLIPACVYTHPEIAAVGMTEKEAQLRNYNFTVAKFPFAVNGKAIAMDSAEGFIKIIAEKETGRVLGAHIIGPRATDLIAEIVLAMNIEGGIQLIADAVHAHPTLAEGIKEAAEAVIGKAVHII